MKATKKTRNSATLDPKQATALVEEALSERGATKPNTQIEVVYPADREPIALRGSHSRLCWSKAIPPVRSDGARHVFEVDVPEGAILEFKLTRGASWSCERNYTVASGETAVVRPYFDRSTGTFEPRPRTIASPQLGRDVTFEVFLPPSYDEHKEQRYPTLYAQDGHIVFSTGSDPFGPSWRMDETLNELYELDAIDEVIVVGVHTREGRLAMLSPSRDPHHGGGDGPRYLDFIVDTLKPAIDAAFRTQAGRSDTAIIGSSMGGLFSFFAAWRRPDVFGKAACLSSSFWWDDRFMVREVRAGGCPVPRPLLYIDSGAAKSNLEEDANRRDGYHHTVSMRNALMSHCYSPGVNVHMLAFAGHGHDNAAWAARLAMPLQLLFPHPG